MYSNSPDNIKSLNPSLRERALSEIISHIGADKDFRIKVLENHSDYILPKHDHPFKKEPEIAIGPEQTLENGLKLAFAVCFVGSQNLPKFIIRLDSRHLIDLPFEGQKGQFTFHLTREHGRATVDFIGKYSDSLVTGSSQPVLDQTLYNRMTQLLDESLATLFNSQKQQREAALIEKMFIDGSFSRVIREILKMQNI